MTPGRDWPLIRMSFRMVARELARKAFRMAKALDANVWACIGLWPNPAEETECFAYALNCWPFASWNCLPVPPLLVLFDPRPGGRGSRPIRALAVPATALCPQPLASPSLELLIPMGSEPSQFRRLPHAHDPWYPQSSSCLFPWGPSSGSSSDWSIPTIPGITKPRATNPRRVQARAVPTTTLFPEPPAVPDLVMRIHVGSRQLQVLVCSTPIGC